MTPFLSSGDPVCQTGTPSTNVSVFQASDGVRWPMVVPFWLQMVSPLLSMTFFLANDGAYVVSNGISMSNVGTFALNLRPHQGYATPRQFVLAVRYSFCDGGMIFYTAHLPALYTRFASGNFLLPLVVELCPCSQGHATTQLMQMLPVVDLSTCIHFGDIAPDVSNYT